MQKKQREVKKKMGRYFEWLRDLEIALLFELVGDREILQSH